MTDPPHAAELAPLPRSPELMRAAETGLLVIDVQERLVAVVPDAARILWNCRRLLEGSRILGVRSAITEQNPDKLGPTAGQLTDAHSGLVARKMAFSCGECGEIFSGWRDAGIERAFLCGIETHVCVAQSAFDLLAAGYQVAIAADAVGSRASLDHDIALRRLESSGATITTVEAALFEWCEHAGAPEFRQLSALIKQPRPSGVA